LGGRERRHALADYDRAHTMTSGFTLASPGAEMVVPGSISNLGPGFDTLSVAVQLYLRIRVLAVRPSAPDTLEVRFVGPAPAGENRIDTAYRLARRRLGTTAPGLVVEASSEIPVRAGLGSSGAASIAGLRLYEAVTGAHPPGGWLAIARELEGHPDNVAAALLGGLTLSCLQEDGDVLARSWRWPADLRLVVVTPEAPLETSFARRILPSTLSMEDAVFNLQRALLFVRALETGTYDDLLEATRDRWHQPARAPYVPGLAEVLTLDHPDVLGACLSGAGPSVLALVREGRDGEVAGVLGALYDRLGVAHKIRVLTAHQPDS